MNSNDKIQFAELMTATGEIYSKEVSKTLMSIYFDALSNYNIDQVKQGFSKHSIDPKHGTFFPKPADIVRNIDGERRSSEDRAMVAWMEIEAAMAKFGAYGTLRMEDKQALMAVKSMGSWQDLCHTPRDKLAFKRQEFIKNYEALENTPVEHLPKSLAGIEDLTNQRLGVDKASEQVNNLMIELERRKSLIET